MNLADDDILESSKKLQLLLLYQFGYLLCIALFRNLRCGGGVGLGMRRDDDPTRIMELW